MEVVFSSEPSVNGLSFANLGSCQLFLFFSLCFQLFLSILPAPWCPSMESALVYTLVRVALAAAVATALAKRGVKKKTLSVAGSRAAFFVGFVSLALSFRFGLTLIAFYYSSSRLTKWRGEEKKKLEADFEKESQRGVAQVGRVCALTFSPAVFD